jgi:hypothetical protein
MLVSRIHQGETLKPRQPLLLFLQLLCRPSHMAPWPSRTSRPTVATQLLLLLLLLLKLLLLQLLLLKLLRLLLLAPAPPSVHALHIGAYPQPLCRTYSYPLTPPKGIVTKAEAAVEAAPRAAAAASLALFGGCIVLWLFCGVLGAGVMASPSSCCCYCSQCFAPWRVPPALTRAHTLTRSPHPPKHIIKHQEQQPYSTLASASSTT